MTNRAFAGERALARFPAYVVGIAFALAACGIGCRAASRTRNPDPSHRARNHHTRELLCGDIGDERCLAACPDSLPPRAHHECLLELRFGSDPIALGLARALHRATDTLLGIDSRAAIDGYAGEEVSLFPALPLGDDRHHLAWLHASLGAYSSFVDALAPHASRLVTFEPRPQAIRFFRTAEPTYPSAFCIDGVISYNLNGPLHERPRDVHETLFHELFHVNDGRRGGWSSSALQGVFDTILERCGEEHDCFGPFAPHDTVVPQGTYYAFDQRTRDVREYGAELALRYLVEHEPLLAGGEPKLPPFKCVTPENRIAWNLLVDEFFGGADLSPDCDAPEVLEALRAM